MSTRSMNVKILVDPPVLKINVKDQKSLDDNLERVLCETDFLSYIIWENQETLERTTEKYFSHLEFQQAMCNYRWNKFDVIVNSRAERRVERERVASLSTLGGMLNTKSLEALQLVAG